MHNVHIQRIITLNILLYFLNTAHFKYIIILFVYYASIKLKKEIHLPSSLWGQAPWSELAPWLNPSLAAKRLSPGLAPQRACGGGSLTLLGGRQRDSTPRGGPRGPGLLLSLRLGEAVGLQALATPCWC